VEVGQAGFAPADKVGLEGVVVGTLAAVVAVRNVLHNQLQATPWQGTPFEKYSYEQCAMFEARGNQIKSTDLRNCIQECMSDVGKPARILRHTSGYPTSANRDSESNIPRTMLSIICWNSFRVKLEWEHNQST
jgi:hypothetical protein